MSTGIFASDGIDLQALVAEHLGPRVLPAVLYRPGAAEARDEDDLTAAPTKGEPTAHPCRGFIEDFRTGSIDGELIKTGDRKITLLGGTLDVEPEPGPDRDEVLIEGTRYATRSLVSRDPAAATYIISGYTK